MLARVEIARRWKPKRLRHFRRREPTGTRRAPPVATARRTMALGRGDHQPDHQPAALPVGL